MHGMSSCWFCHETIDEPADVPTTPLIASGQSAAPTSVATRPVQEAPAPHPSVPVFPRRHQRSPAGALLLWLFLAIFMTGVLLAVEAAMPRFPAVTPASLELETQAFTQLGFSIAYPETWNVSETKERASFTATEPVGPATTRGLRVTRSDLDFKKVGERAGGLNRRLVRGYRTLDRARATLDGRDAYIFVFAGDDLRFEQWWIDLGKRTLRLEFWSRLADDGALEVNERIARTLRLL